MQKTGMEITFWGTRGSLPVINGKVLRYGGNTSCVQVQVEETLLIFDAGTGIYHLGQQLLKKGGSITGHIFLSHYHWDHINGLPFFAPLFGSENTFTIYGEAKSGISLEEIMARQMSYPYFPVAWKDVKASVFLKEIQNGEVLELEKGIKVRAVSGNHPDGSLSYRIDYKGASCCYLLDNEHYPAFSKELKDMIRNADVLIYDAAFTDEEYEGLKDGKPRRGWGHSTWQEGVKLAQEVKAGMLVLSHHAIERTDEELDVLEMKLKEEFPFAVIAKEGMVVRL